MARCLSFERVDTTLSATGRPAGMDPLYLFGLITFWIYLQLWANLRVLLDSLQKSCDGDRQPSIVVLQLPPRLSLRIDVNLEFLYGIKLLGLPLQRASTTPARL